MIRESLRVWVLLTALGGTATLFAAEPLKVAVKKGQEWIELDTWTVAHAAGFQPRTEPAKLSVYGGDPSHKVEATGFFRTQQIGERWWLVVGASGFSGGVSIDESRTEWKRGEGDQAG